LAHDAQVAWSKLLGHSEHVAPYHWSWQWQVQAAGAPLTEAALPLQGFATVQGTHVG
jgi:hypothetical protein